MKAGYPPEWRGLGDENAIIEAARSLGLAVASPIAGRYWLETRRWYVTAPFGAWSEPRPEGIDDASTDEVRAYLFGVYEARRAGR